MHDILEWSKEGGGRGTMRDKDATIPGDGYHPANNGQSLSDGAEEALGRKRAFLGQLILAASI